MNRLFVTLIMILSVSTAHAWPDQGSDETPAKQRSVRKQERIVRELVKKLQEAEKAERKAIAEAEKALDNVNHRSGAGTKKADKALLRASIARLNTTVAQMNARSAASELERLLAGQLRNSNTASSDETLALASSTYYASERPSFQGPNVEPWADGIGTLYLDSDPSEGRGCSALLNER